jgi:hypothetical protein
MTISFDARPDQKNFLELLKDVAFGAGLRAVGATASATAEIVAQVGSHIYQASKNLYEASKQHVGKIAVGVGTTALAGVGATTIGAPAMLEMTLALGKFGLLATGVSVGAISALSIAICSAKGVKMAASWATMEIAERIGAVKTVVNNWRSMARSGIEAIRNTREAQIVKSIEGLSEKRLDFVLAKVKQKLENDGDGITENDRAILGKLQEEATEIMGIALKSVLTAFRDCDKKDQVRVVRAGRRFIGDLSKQILKDVAEACGVATSRQDFDPKITTIPAEVTAVFAKLKSSAGSFEVSNHAGATADDTRKEVSNEARGEEVVAASVPSISCPREREDRLNKLMGICRRHKGEIARSGEDKDKVAALTETGITQISQFLHQHFPGASARYSATDPSLLSQAIKRASIPADRKIPHFDDLLEQIGGFIGDAQDSSSVILKINGDEITITAGDQTLRLKNRHPALGGKVTVFYGEEQKGSMWNDDALKLVQQFLSTQAFPVLRQAPPVTNRVIAKIEPKADKSN